MALRSVRAEFRYRHADGHYIWLETIAKCTTDRFNRAARFIEQMEMDGMLGPQEGSKPRKVIAPK